MSFTVNQLLHGTNFPLKENHRLRLGRRFVRSYRSIYQEDPKKYSEISPITGDVYEVMLYPDSFKKRAEMLVKRYYKDYWKGKRMWVREKKKRKRIVKYQKIEK